MKTSVHLTSRELAAITDALMAYALTVEDHVETKRSLLGRSSKTLDAQAKRAATMRKVRDKLMEEWTAARERQVIIKRTFTVDPERGIAGTIVGSSAEGLPLDNVERKGDKVVATYCHPRHPKSVVFHVPPSSP